MWLPARESLIFHIQDVMDLADGVKERRINIFGDSLINNSGA